MKVLNPIKLIVLLIGSLTQQALCQTITWTSSDTAVATVDAAGVVSPVSDGTVTITATVEQNGKTATSSKTVETVLDDCTPCFTFQSSIDTQARTYCGVKLSNGQCWMDRNIGASRVATGYNDTSAYGIMWRNNTTAPANTCPSGWKVPTANEILSGWSSSIGVSLKIGTSKWSDYHLTLAAGPLKVSASCTSCNEHYNSTYWIRSASGHIGWERVYDLHTNSNSIPVGVRCLKS